MIKWKDIYKKVNHKEYCKILDIQEGIEIKSNLQNFLEKDKLIIISIIAILFILFIVIYKLKIQALLISLLLLFLLLVVLILTNTYKLSLKNNKVIINGLIKKDEIKFDDLCNVYLERNKYRYALFIPIYYYNLVFIYKEKDEVYKYSLSTIMVKKEEIAKLFKHFKLEELPIQKKVENNENEQEKVLKVFKITAAIVVLIAIIVTGLVVTLNK